MVNVFARKSGVVVAALLACVSTGIFVIPAKAVPIARGLSALSAVLEQTSSQKAEPIPFAQSLRECGSSTAGTTLSKLTLLTIDPDNAFDLSIQSGGTNGGRP